MKMQENMDKIKKKSIALLSLVYEPYWSGAEKMVNEIAARLQNEYDISIITLRYQKTDARVERIDNYRIVRVGWGVGMLNKLLFPLLAALKTRQIKPDIAHAIMESYAGGALVILKYIYPKARRILTLQSGDLDDPLKQKKWLIRFFFKLIHLTPHKLTAISSFLAKRAERLGASAVAITPNGVDLSHIPDLSAKQENRVVFVGRISWEKGVDYLIKAWPEVVKAVPEAKLVLVGPDDNREMDAGKAARDMIEKLGIKESVEFTGGLEHKDTLKEIAKSEIFICPSLAEGLGIVFIEAQACGAPPIGTRVGGIPDVIQHEDNGLLVEPKNSDEIAKALIQLLTNKELTARLRARGLETVKKFEWDTVIEQFNRIYNDILK